MTDPTPFTAFPAPGHDHGRCVRTALDAAESRCRSRGARLTSIRRRVLELVWASHGPVGAYALLDILRGEGQATAPPTVYRALDFLMEQGLIHRLERRNAFIGCAHPSQPHTGLFLICARCGLVAEVDDETVEAAVDHLAGALGFAVRSRTVEVEGLCPLCREGDGAHG
ncbi:MAG: transcriptional repressor [Rhodospirillales bacterium]|nr:transcriptional repressor [Rhodospirillales bacterium]